MLKYAEIANNLITWLRSKTQILALIHDLQTAMLATNPLAKVLSVIRAVITRWTAYYMAYHQLLELMLVLQMLVKTHRERVLAGNTATHRKAKEMIKVIENPVFWHSLQR